MSARAGDIVAGGGFLGEAVAFGDGKVGIAIFNEQPGQTRRIEFVASSQVHVVRLAEASQGDRARHRQRNAELAGLFAILDARREQRALDQTDRQRDPGWEL